MKSDGKNISGIFIRKSNTYLKVALFIFICTLISMSTILILSVNQQSQDKKNYVNNHNVHTITVSSKLIGDNVVQDVSLEDIDKIQHILNKENIQDKEYRISPVFQISAGVVDKHTEEGYVLLGIPEEATWLVGDRKLEGNSLYTKKISNSSTTLMVDVIEEVEGGIEAKEAKEISVKMKELRECVLTLYEEPHEGLRYAYINEKFFRNIYDTINSQSKLKSSNSQLPIEDLYLYVNNIYDIDHIAKILETNGYQVKYTLQAFNSLGRDLRLNNILLYCFVVVFFLITIIIVILSFHSYLKIQQKDIGILKSWGYENYTLEKIYGKNINSMFGKIFVVVCCYTAVLGGICLPRYGYKEILGIIGILGIVLLLINRYIIKIVLKKYITKDILTLVKVSKEFE